MPKSVPDTNAFTIIKTRTEALLGVP